MYKSAIAGLALLVFTACYENVPIGTSEPAVGKEIVVEITSAGAAKVAQYIGPGAMSLAGRLISAQPDSVKLAVTTVTRENGEEQFWKGETVAIGRSDISRISQRKLSPTRTALAATILAGAVFTVRQVIGNITGGQGKDKGPPVGQ